MPDARDGGVTESLTFANATLVLPGGVARGWLHAENGVIVGMGEGANAPAGAVDCGGDFLAPGLIELHTDNLERHIEPRPGVDWPHAAAIVAHDAELASTGITTVFDAMRVGSIPTGKGRYRKYARSLASEMLDLRAADTLKISHFLHLRAEVCSETLAEELAEFGREDRVGLVSIMDHTPGQRQFRDISKLEQYVKSKRGMSDAEFIEHIAHLKDLRARNGAAHEAVAVQEAARFGAVLASHDDTTAEQVAVSAGHGIRLAEFPTTVEAARACHEHAIAVMMGAPNLIRGGSHSGNVAAEDLARERLLDIVSSDYVPAALLQAAVRLGETWGDMARGIATVTKAPAEAVGLDDRGVLEEGRRADLMRFRVAEHVPLLRGVWSRGRQVA
ncbi:alpha-D-ribose 1-methylphosphonate 5-triphosphate diphosphatase [Mameliella sp. MMSF_3552]|uniref:alpha-D-ribose 1-methylphosphonate 5-triphosphate diphosphatase n=1 Tax=unclassified Mameliella TaxID=2630630 RepID=UPI0035319FFA